MLGQLAGFLLGSSQLVEQQDGGVEDDVTAVVAALSPCCQPADPELNDWVIVADEAGGCEEAAVVAGSTPGTPGSHLTVEDNWTLTPAACLDGLGSPLPSASSLENLLLEHPSMSVYRRGPALPQPRARLIAQTPPSRLAQIADSQQLCVRQTRKSMAQSVLERNNKAREMSSAGNQRQRRRHHYNMRHSGANNSRKC